MLPSNAHTRRKCRKWHSCSTPAQQPLPSGHRSGPLEKPLRVGGFSQRAPGYQKGRLPESLSDAAPLAEDRPQRGWSCDP